MSGTFILHSWDVMEPIAYCMMLGNFTTGLLFYSTCKKELGLITLKTMISNRFAKRLYKKKGLNIERFNQLEAEI